MCRMKMWVLCLFALLPWASAQESKTAKPDKEASQWIGPDNTSITVLTRYLQSKQPLVVRAALQDLATRGLAAKPAIPRIQELLNDSDAAVRIDAAWTLIDLGVEADRALAGVLKAAQGKDTATRAYAIKALGEIVNPALVFACWGPGPRPWIPRPQFAKRVVPVAVTLLQDKEKSVRRASATALQTIGPGAKAAVPALLRALKDQDAEVRLSAAKALECVDPTAAKKAHVK
jgi:HEAT repeat protein